MSLLLNLRDFFGRLYGEHDVAVRLFLKFLMALTAFAAINWTLGEAHLFSNVIVLVILAFLCVFLPSNSILLIGTVIILVNFYSISLEAALAGGGILLICLLLYFCIAPSSAAPLILSAVCTGLGIPAAPAVLFGLVGGPLSAAGAGFGVLICYILGIVKEHGDKLTAVSEDAADAMVEKMAGMISLIISDRAMLLTAAAVVLLLWIVWIIHLAEFQHSWITAAFIGILFYVGVILLGDYQLQLKVDIYMLVLDAGVSLLTAWIVQMMLFHLDFMKTENVRFEDDTYYYFVKAVPKKVVTRKKKVRR